MKSDNSAREDPGAICGEFSSWEDIELGANEGCGSSEVICVSVVLN